MQITDPDCYELVYKNWNYQTTEKMPEGKIKDGTRTTTAEYVLM